MTVTNTQTEKIFLTRADLKALGIEQSNSSLLRAEGRNAFPRRLRLSAAKICWDRQEVLDWIEARKAERVGWHYADSY